MKAVADTNGEGYKLPTKLSIFVGDSTVELEREYYTIDEITPQYEAEVTINGEKIVDNIKISGEGIQQGYYAVDVSKCFGVTVTVDSDLPPYFFTNEDGTVTFTKDGEYQLPAAENIIVKFDNNDWINPSENSEWCTYDTNTNKLTLKANKAKSNVMIVARSPEYQILDEISWDKLSDYSTSGYAPYLFYIGEEKTVKVNGLDHKVRIIGFNHDDLVSGDKAGITFEFKNVITNSNGSAATTRWNNKNGKQSTNYDFPNSTLNDLLNKNDDCIFNKLPDELKTEGIIKEVRKKVGLSKSYSTLTPYYTKLFPLAHDEMVDHKSRAAVGEGSKYQYYIDHSNQENRIKTKVNSSSGEYYWLRSPLTNYNSGAWRCNKAGALYDGDDIAIYDVEYTVAPAFCI